MNDWPTFFEHLLLHPRFWYIFGGVFGLLFLLLGYRVLRYGRRPIPVFRTAAGNVGVSPGALQDIAEAVASELGVVGRPRMLCKARGGVLSMVLRVRFAAGVRLPEVTARLQDAMAQVLRSSLGVEKLWNIDVIVTGFKGGSFTDALQQPKEDAVTSNPYGRHLPDEQFIEPEEQPTSRRR